MSFLDFLNKKKKQVVGELNQHVIQPTENFINKDIVKPAQNIYQKSAREINQHITQPLANAGVNKYLPQSIKEAPGQMVHSVKDYIQPHDEVRPIDYIREIPKANLQVTKKVGNMVADIGRQFIRYPIFVNQTMKNQGDFVPETKLEKALLGDEPIKPAQSNTTSNYLKSKGVSPGMATGAALMMGGLDYGSNFFGGGEVKNLAKETTEQGIKKLLGKEAVNYSDEVIKQLAKSQDEKIIKGLLKNRVAEDAAKYTAQGKIKEKIGTEIVDPTLKTNPTTKPNLATETTTPQIKELPTTHNNPLDQQFSDPNMVSPSQSIDTKIPAQQTASTGEKLVKKSQQSYTDNIAQNTRSFNETVRNADTTNPELRAKIQDELYTTRNSKELAIKAKNLVEENPNFARDLFHSKNDDVSVAVGSELIKKLQQSPETLDEAVDIANKLAKNLTEAGRTSQAASLYANMTPDGILRFAQKEINKAMELQPKLKIGLTSEKAAKIVAMSKKVAEMPEGYDKEVATKEMLKEIYDIIPPTLVKKVATFQTMAQLLNPKTMIRNVGGNAAFQGLENISQTIATPLDTVLSWATGKRTTTLPSLKTQIKSGYKGLIDASKEAVKGINTSGSTQFDLNDIPVFRNGILGAAEKALNISLRATDRAAFQSAFDDSIRGALKLAKTDKVTPAMIEEATQLGWYRTFQDKNMVSDFFVNIKKTLNTISFKQGNDRFGLGDLILKYPKTPANLIARGIDYSPAGFIKSVFEIGKPLFGKPFNQKAFVDSFSRALVGSAGLVGTGVILGKLGIITEAPSKDKDVRGLQKVTGQGAYQINVSALKRFILSGLNKDAGKLREGDTLVNYDWAQPAAIPLSMGAKIGHGAGAKDTAISGVDALNEGVSTLAEQPMVKQLQQFASGQQGLTETAVNTIKSAPASFVPTAVNQIGQMADNTARQTINSNPWIETKNLVQTKIPIWRNSLPERVDVTGNTQETYQDGSNSFFNVFLNPAFVNKYKPTPATDEVLRLMDTTGKTSQVPRVQTNKVMVNGQSMVLQPEQVNEMQRYIGTRTQSIIEELQNDPAYINLSDDDKVKKMTSILSDLGTAAKVELLGHKLTKNDSGVMALLNGGYSIGGTKKASLPKISGMKTLLKTKYTKGKSTKVKKIKIAKSTLKAPKPPKLKIKKAKQIKVTYKKFKVKG